MQANPIAGNGYNRYYWGGYLAWHLYPEKKIFVDGRIPAYPAGFMQTVQEMRKDPSVSNTVSEFYDFQYLLISDDHLFWDIDVAYPNDYWMLVYWDQSGAQIYIRNNEQNFEYIDHYSYRFYVPGFDDNSLAKVQNNPEYLQRLNYEIQQHYSITGEKIDLRFLPLTEQSYFYGN